jgi:hypothetical protein
MWKMISIKVDPRMKKALEVRAKLEFSSVSGILKKAAEKYLLEHNINWREITDEELQSEE